MTNIRTPAVAGMFYPGKADDLAERVDTLLASVPEPPAGRVRAAVSPHAGYPYSGRVAANTYRALSRSRPRTVVVIGPSHVEYFPFTSVFDGDGYETPLGVLGVDTDLAARVAARGGTIRRSPSGHAHDHLARGEHGIEVQIPFLQRALEGAAVVPIVMGEQRWEHCRELAEALADAAGDDVAVVASSDLSHFHDHARADELDGVFADTLAAMDARALYEAVDAGRCEACGAGPVMAALGAVESVSGRTFHLLERTDSGAVTGDTTSVVGYLSAVVATQME